MGRPNDAEIAARSVEVSKCLLNASAGLTQFDLETTLRTGDAARLAVNIRNARDKISVGALAGISAALKIDWRIACAELVPLFESLGWVRANRKGPHLENVIESIPPNEDILSQLGKMWQEQEPTPVDESTVKALSLVSKRPYSSAALVSDLDMLEADVNVALDYGESGKYFGRFRSEEHGTDSVWSPLYWPANADKVVAFIKEQGDSKLKALGSISENLKRHPGLPSDRVPSEQREAIDEGVQYGFFPSVAVLDRNGKGHEYIYAAMPQFDTTPQMDIFEKARLIVACVRHGQYDAEITPILYPRRVLYYMRHNAMKPHPYANIQYALLVLHGIVRLEPDSTRHGSAFRVSWIDSPENNLAADIADQLLSGEQTLAGTATDVEAQKVLVQGVFNYTSEQRRRKTTEKIQAKTELRRLMEKVSGVRV